MQYLIMKGGFGMAETYVTTAANGKEYANKIAEKLQRENPNATVKVEKGSIPGWGGGYSEAGYRITVEKNPK